MPQHEETGNFPPVPDSPQTLNLYGYVGNNPTTRTDPDGHFTFAGEVVGVSPEAAEQAGIEDQKKKDKENMQNAAEAKEETAASLAAQVPPEVKQAITASVNASNSPGGLNGSDKQGGFHEEGGQWGTTTSGKTHVAPAVPGPYSNPADKNKPSMDPSVSVNPSQKQNWQSFDGTWHVHPAGTVVDANGTHSFKQVSSPVDRKNATTGINIVVGAKDRQVYFFNNSREIGHISLKQFMKEP